MSGPINFTSTSPRYGLPFLFAGQAQKEFTVNEAHAIADMLLHPSIKDEQPDPPANPVDGECWIVGANATAEWAGREDEIVCRQAGNWIFAAPREGMSVFDEGAGQMRFFNNGWQSAVAVAEASGGTTEDTEARQAIAGLISALVTAGVLPSS